jgi:hypothetical protein
VNTNTVEGSIVSGIDSREYYAWLRSPLVEGRLQSDTDYAPLLARPGVAETITRTPTGLLANLHSIGPAIAWAPAVTTVHLVLLGLGDHSPWPADGFSPPYQLAVGGSTLALALLTLFLTHRIARRFAAPTAAATAAAMIVLATPAVVYGSVEMSMAHGPATASVCLFILVWLRSLASLRLSRWIGLGCLLGLVCLMRWQLATFCVIPALEAAWLAARPMSLRRRLGVVVRLTAAAVTTVLVFSPQFLARYLVYGNALGGLQHTGNNWLSPDVWRLLFSTDRSLFYWTPITLPAFAAMAYWAARARGAALAIVTVAVVVQIYTLSALLGPGVFLGWSFGCRFLTETCILLVPGLAIVLDRAGPERGRWVVLFGGGLVAWFGEGAVEPTRLIRMVWSDFLLQPLEVGLMLGLSGVMTYTFISALRPDSARIGGTAYKPRWPVLGNLLRSVSAR